MAAPVEILAGIGLCYNNPSSGLNGNRTWKQKAEIRKSAAQAIKDTNEIVKEHRLLLEQIGRHEVTNSKETATTVIKTLQDGLQKSYDVLFEEFLLLKEKLEKDESFLKKHGNKLTREELIIYHDEFLLNVRIAIDEIDLNLVNELINAIRYDEFGSYRLETIEKEKSPLQSLVARMNAKSLVKEIYKTQGKVTSLDVMEEITARQIKNIIEENKLYYKDFIELTKKMLVYNMVLIANAYTAAGAMQKAIGSYDLIPSHRVFPETIMTLLQDDAIGSFRNLQKSLSQLKSMVGNLMKTVNKAITVKRQTERVMQDGDNIKQKA